MLHSYDSDKRLQVENFLKEWKLHTLGCRK